MRRDISQDPDPVDPPGLLPLDTERSGEEHRTRAKRGTCGGLSLNDLIRSRQERLRDGQPEGLGGLEVDGRYVFCRRLHGKFRRGCSPQNAVDIRGRLSRLIDEVGTVGHEAAGVHVKMEWIDRRQAIPRREPDNDITVQTRRTTWQNQQAATWCACKRCDDTLDVRSVLDGTGHKLDCERTR